MAELERKIGQQDDGDRFFKASLAACRGAAPAAGTEQRRAFYQQVEKEVKTSTRMSVVKMCRWRGSAGAATTVSLDPGQACAADMELRDQMQKVALEWPSYGSRRITAELKARGWDGQSQAGAAADAGRQSAVCDQAQVCADDRLGPRVRPTRLRQRTAKCRLTGCLTPGVQSILYDAG